MILMISVCRKVLITSGVSLADVLGGDINVYDFDDIGVPEGADNKWRQESSEKWLEKLVNDGEDACLLGQIVLGEIMACPSFAKLDGISFCLLDVSDFERIQRLKKRNTYGADQNMLNWAAWLRMHHQNPAWGQHVIKDGAWDGLDFSVWDKEAHWPESVTIIDTTDLSISEVAKQVAQWIYSDNMPDSERSTMSSEELGLPIFYQEFPEYFDTPSDIYLTNDKNEVIESLLQKYAIKSVLDMACGTGAQVLYLAEKGYTVIGADFSPQLVKIARDKAKQQNISAWFTDGDMRELSISGFDAVITIDNAIGHLVKSDFELAIRNIVNNLNDGGLYIFDILNLDAMTDDVIKADSERMTDKRITADGTTIINIRSSTIDRDDGYLISENNFTFQKDGKEKKVKNKSILQIYTMDELRNILSNNGFQVLEQYKADAYTFAADDSGYSIITVAKKG